MYGCTPYCATNDMGGTESRESFLVCANENRFWLVSQATLFAQFRQCLRDIRCKWNQAFLSTFPAK
jgi:hypothetical protein